MEHLNGMWYLLEKQEKGSDRGSPCIPGTRAFQLRPCASPWVPVPSGPCPHSWGGHGPSPAAQTPGLPTSPNCRNSGGKPRAGSRKGDCEDSEGVEEIRGSQLTLLLQWTEASTTHQPAQTSDGVSAAKCKDGLALALAPTQALSGKQVGGNKDRAVG